jgi:recombination associated protein RdgC
MFFKNLTLFRFSKSAAEELETLDPKHLKKHAARACGPLEMRTRGWISPYGRQESELAHALGAFTLLSLGGEDKLLPAAVVNEALGAKLAKLSEERGKPIGGRERKRIKDEIVTDLLPRAFSRPYRLNGYLDAKKGWIVVDSASRKSAEDFVSQIRETVETFPALPLDPEESPRALLTQWLADGKLPEGLALGDECELRDPADRGSVVRVRRLDLESTEVREHLKTGKQVAQLGLVFDERVSFTLGDDLALRKIKFLDVVTEELESTERDSAQAELAARFALMTLTLGPLLERLEKTFRLPRPSERGTR